MEMLGIWRGSHLAHGGEAGGDLLTGAPLPQDHLSHLGDPLFPAGPGSH